MSRRVRHFIGAVFFKPGARFFVREASWRTIVSRFYDLPV
jgi:hypothetical protein